MNPVTETLVDVRKFLNKLLDMKPDEVEDSLVNNGEKVVHQITRAIARMKRRGAGIMKEREVVVYIEGGVCQNVLLVQRGKPRAKWKQADYTLVDFDIEGSEENQ